MEAFSVAFYVPVKKLQGHLKKKLKLQELTMDTFVRIYFKFPL